MKSTRAAIAAALALLLLPASATADPIRVQSTTDTVDAGLVDGLLRDAYAQAQPGDTLQYTAVGTGAALTNARNGLADVVITHAPSLEKQFVDDGYSIGLGRQIFYSDYVIVGPKGDPAGVAAADPHDAAGAFEAIDAYGLAHPAAVRFLSRGDNSGTNVQEQLIWGLTGVVKQPASNAGGNPARFEPGSGGMYPAYYKKTATGQAANLNQAEACTDVATHDGCYTMLDRGTFNRLVNAGTVTHLKIVSEKNTASARGGENLLVNPFAAYLVNPEKIATDPKPNVAAATRFVDFLTSPGFQTALETFPNAVDPAFRPDAFPNVTLDTPLPQTAAVGSTITVAGTVANRLPGGSAVSGLPVQLQRSTDGGATYAAVGAPAPTDAAGHFSTSVAVAQRTSYRVSLPEFAAQPAAVAYNAFTATTQDLGVVGVPGPTPVPIDALAPHVTQVKLTRRHLSLRVDEAATITAVVNRRVHKRKGGFRYRLVRIFRLDSQGAQVVTRKHGAYKRGTYRIRITASDAAHNEKTIRPVLKRT